MRNLKHTIIALAAIVMVGTLSVFQVSDMSAQKLQRDMKLSTANQTASITIASAEDETGATAVALPTTEEDEAVAEAAPVDEATEQAIAEKSYLTLGYANVIGSADLRAEPNEDAAVTGTMSGADQVEILESTEGWYKVSVNGMSGYVKSDSITLDKDAATETAMQYDHYKLASVTPDSGLTIRSSGSESADSIGSIEQGDVVTVVDHQGDYAKILYGDDYQEGYVLTTGLTNDGEWVEKDDVHAEIIRVAEEKEEAARQEEIARQNAARASATYSTTDNTSSSSSASSSSVSSWSAGSSSSSSSKGQAIVNTAMQYLGVPYVWGGTSPSGFDCSGLVQYVCSKNGISVPRVAASQRNAGTYVSRENLQPGDLVFFSHGGGISHVGIYIGNGNMIHAPQTGDVVKISSIETSYRIQSYAGAVRVW